jgi:hypothetical protein
LRRYPGDNRGASVADVATTAWEVLSLSRGRAQRLTALRIDALESVQIASNRLGASLRGSWQWGDFHVDEKSGVSRSDMDLWAPHRRLVTSVETRAGVLRVSIHPADYESSLSLEGSLCFALINLATARVCLDDDPYLLAKCQLMLGRRSVYERYVDVAARSSRRGVSALAAKLGVEHPQPRRRGCLQVEPGIDPPPQLVPLFERLLVGRPRRRELDLLGVFMNTQLHELHESQRRYLVDKVTRLAFYAG